MKVSALTQAGLDRLHQAMVARVENGSLPGIVTLVAQGDDVYVDVIGATAFGGDRPMRRDTIFRITSMTKPILGAATMLLVDSGQLALHEPVARLVPELSSRRVLKRVDGPLDETVAAHRPITVEDLLTFRPGYGFIIVEPTTFNPRYPIIQRADELQLAMAQPDPRTPHDPEEWIARFATLPLMYQPGERWQYNAASLVLGVLVSRAAGQPLGAFLQDRLFEPLGMRDTGFVMAANKVGRLPTEYTTDFSTGEMGEMTITGPGVWTTPPPFPSGAAGLLSTVDDYLAFARLLLDRGVHQGRRLLSEASIEAMTTNHLTPEQIAGGGVLLDGQGWGYCMGVSVLPDDVSAPGRYGWSGGYGTTWFNDPNRGRIAIALTQVSDFLFNGGLTEFNQLAALA
ncbi:MAG TPA: serine hydrolase domain-containing protein [Candidatus Dormibacteraeota bacterium]|nr:serine hydrolase domain-containing protein [Candidatus Dormibacteraeota bacterium]